MAFHIYNTVRVLPPPPNEEGWAGHLYEIRRAAFALVELTRTREPS